MTEREVSSERVSEYFVEQVAKEIAKHTYARCLPQMSDCEDWDAMEEADRKIYRAAAEAVLALCSSVKTVGVKPLEWEECHDDRGDGFTEHNGGFEASSALGVYEIGMGFGSDSYYWSLTDPIGNEIGDGDDPDKLKAAAQTDYERRILSSLEASPVAASEVAEEMVERGKAARLDVLSGPDEEDPDDRVDRMIRSILTAALKGDRP